MKPFAPICLNCGSSDFRHYEKIKMKSVFFPTAKCCNECNTKYLHAVHNGGTLAFSAKSIENAKVFVKRVMIPFWEKNLVELVHAQELSINAYAAWKMNMDGIPPFADPKLLIQEVYAMGYADDQCIKSVEYTPIPNITPADTNMYCWCQNDWHLTTETFVQERLGFVQLKEPVNEDPEIS